MYHILKESFKIISFTVIAIFLYINFHDDMLDFFGPTTYNCLDVEKALINRQHTNIPPEIILECRKLREQTRHTINT